MLIRSAIQPFSCVEPIDDPAKLFSVGGEDVSLVAGSLNQDNVYKNPPGLIALKC